MASVNSSAPSGSSRPKLLEQVRAKLRLEHYSARTEKTDIDWIKRFILYHGKRHPSEMGADEVRAFLTHLAAEKNVAASTQNQALSALIFLYREVLKLSLPWVDQFERAHQPRKIPVVFTREEAFAVIARLNGTPRLMAQLLYGSGLRLMECVRLRIKDVDLGYLQITVRDGKGGRDRITMLPVNVADALRQQVGKVARLHEEDLSAGAGEVYLPHPLTRKAPGAARELAWQYVFPASKRSS